MFLIVWNSLWFFVLKDQSSDVQWQPNSLHPSSNTPPVERQIAYFPITGAGAGPTTPAGQAQFSALPVS